MSCEMTSSSFTPAFTRFSASCITSPIGPRHEVAAHRRDDAERAAVVAAFGDLQVRVVLRRELDALRRHEVGERIVRLAAGARAPPSSPPAVACGPVTASTAGCAVCTTLVLRAQAAGDDHLAVLGERFADRVERFLDRRVDEAAGVDDDEVGAGVVGRDGVALGAQLREDALGVDQRLGTAERDEADLRRLSGLALVGIALARSGRNRGRKGR